MDEREIRSRIAEQQRNLELRRLGLLSEVRDEAYDRLTRLLADLLDVPIARLSVVEPEQQFFKSEANLTEAGPQMRSTPLSHAFCKFVVAGGKPLVINDAAADPRYQQHLGYLEHGARAYAGFPVRSPSGNVLASFCVVDSEPHEWSDEELRIVETLTDVVADEIHLRHLMLDIDEHQRERDSLLEAIGEGVLGVDRNGVCIYANLAASRILQRSTNDLIGASIADMFADTADEDSAGHGSSDRIMQAVAHGERYQSRNATAFQADGFPIPAELSINPVESDEEPAAVLIFDDVREQRAAEHALADAEFRLRTLFENVPAITFVAHADDPNHAIFVNPQVETLLGYTPAEWLSQPALATTSIHEEDRTQVQDAFAHAAETGENLSSEYRMISRGGRIIWVRNDSRLIRDDGNRPLFWLGITVDVSEQKRLEQRLFDQAYRDPVANLPNRAWFTERLRTISVNSDGESQTGRSVAVIFFDLDNFKVVNDTLGHATGDALLFEVGQRVSRLLHGSGVVSRLGGDEFAILLEEAPDPATLQHLAESIRRTTQEPIVLDGHAVRISSSIGIATSALSENVDLNEIVKHADLAMYDAKRWGKGSIAYFTDDMASSVREHMSIEMGLRQALQAGELDVHYQPIIDLTTGEVCELEALVRWTHPARGPISPAEFIPIAEQAGLISQLGHWVLETAARQVANWQDEFGRPSLRLAVNVSAMQYRRPALVEEIETVLKAYDFRPDKLTIEITESQLLDEEPLIHETLSLLRALGVRLSVDDFGTGFSALRYLKLYPVNALKIHREFIQDITQNPRDAAIAGAVISLAETMDLQVTAEGIEDAAQLELLLKLGCQRGQGYYFSKPLNANEIADQLRNSTNWLKLA